MWGKCEFLLFFLFLFSLAFEIDRYFFLMPKRRHDSIMLTRYLSNSLALAEARLILAKLIWNFDFELDGDHESWVDDARFYVSSISTYTAVSHV